MKRIYLDYAASTPLHPEVFAKMEPYFLTYYGNPSSSHANGRQLRAALETSRRTIAGMLGAEPSEIIFTSGGTEADNTAIRGAVKSHNVKHIISSKIEHHAVLHTIEELEKEGQVTVHYVRLKERGLVDLEHLEALLSQHPHQLVALMHANNEIGTLLDLQKVGGLCKKYQALFMSDTVQTVGNLPFDLKNTPIHFITASAHKFSGPKGVGFLYVKKGTTISSTITGGSQEKQIRAGTENVASVVGMAHALKWNYDKLTSKREKIWEINQYMKTLLMKYFPTISFNSPEDPSESLPTVLNVSFNNEEDLMLLFHLDIQGIAVSGGSACSSGATMGSHVLSGIGKDHHHIKNAIRFSFSDSTTKEEINYVINKLKKILKISVTV